MTMRQPKDEDARLAQPPGGEAEVDSLRREVKALRRELEDMRAIQREAVRDRQTYFGLVAHQLKGPLLPLEVSLHAIARALRKGRELPPDAMPRTLRQTRRLARIIEALLVDLPRVDTGTLTVEVVRFDLRTPVRDAVDELRSLIDNRTFTLELPDAEVEVLCDPARVSCIVTSLLDNAVKYSSPGTEVRVAVERNDAEAVVRVTDHGIGIPEAELGQVFSKFYRGSNAPSYLYRGLGVGLYLAQAYAELCHGRVTVESEQGKGTTARLFMPLARAKTNG